MSEEPKNPSPDSLGKAAEASEMAGKSTRDLAGAAPSKLLRRTILLFIMLLSVFVGISWFKYFSFQRELQRRAAELAAGPRVRVAKVTRGIGEHDVALIGETRPYQSATLYAKVSGYLKAVLVDKGDVVEEGQILARIESPETDEAYLAAEADARNKRAIWKRMQLLFSKGLISEQEADQAQADAEVAGAKLRAQRTFKEYETLKAPYPGTITARYADPGALVQNATNSETSALPVVMISQVDRLRVDLFLDQRDAPFVSKDDPVLITLAERPGFRLEGKVARLSRELDPRTKMQLTEVDIPNEKESLVAGSFVQVSLGDQIASLPRSAGGGDGS